MIVPQTAPLKGHLLDPWPVWYIFREWYSSTTVNLTDSCLHHGSPQDWTAHFLSITTAANIQTWEGSNYFESSLELVII